METKRLAPSELVSQVQAASEHKDIPLKSPEQLPGEFRECAETLKEIGKLWSPVELYTATNLHEERNKFFADYEAGTPTNPQFEYGSAEYISNSENRQKLDDLRFKIHSLTASDSTEQAFKVMLHYLFKDLKGHYNLAQALDAHDEEATGLALKQLYSGISPELVERAEHHYEGLIEAQKLPKTDLENWLQSIIVSQEEVAEAFKWGLQQYGLYREIGQEGPGYQVILTPDVSSIDVRHRSKQGPTVFVPTKRLASPVNAQGLIELLAHEIDAHATQPSNGGELFILGGDEYKIADDTTYEGEALNNEYELQRDLFGKQGTGSLPYFTLAISMAESGGSFVEIFEDQLNRRLHVAHGIPKDREISLDELKTQDEAIWKDCRDSAFLTTYRILRGHRDTSNKEGYANPKDAAYFAGAHLVSLLREEGLGHLNHAVAAKPETLPLIARIQFSPADIPHKRLRLGHRYFYEKLLPRYEEYLNTRNSSKLQNPDTI